MRHKVTKRIQRGRNTHWIANDHSDRVVLRRCAKECTPASLDYEFRVLRHLSKRGWPVPAPIAEPLEAFGSIWCLFPYLPGRSPAPRSSTGIAAEQRRRGRLLARLHADLAGLSSLGQRDGWRRADEGLVARPNRGNARDVLSQYEHRDPKAGRILLDFHDRARARLGALLPTAPAPIVIHGDFAPWNMHYARGKLTGLFDFDLAHLDLRIADFALSWRGKHDGVLAGYQEESALSEIERQLLIPVYWSWMIGCAVADIEAARDPEWAITHLLRQPHE